jgi:hypothetical protein
MQGNTPPPRNPPSLTVLDKHIYLNSLKEFRNNIRSVTWVLGGWHQIRPYVHESALPGLRQFIVLTSRRQGSGPEERTKLQWSASVARKLPSRDVVGAAAQGEWGGGCIAGRASACGARSEQGEAVSSTPENDGTVCISFHQNARRHGGWWRAAGFETCSLVGGGGREMEARKRRGGGVRGEG